MNFVPETAVELVNGGITPDDELTASWTGTHLRVINNLISFITSEIDVCPF